MSEVDKPVPPPKSAAQAAKEFIEADVERERALGDRPGKYSPDSRTERARAKRVFPRKSVVGALGVLVVAGVATGIHAANSHHQGRAAPSPSSTSATSADGSMWGFISGTIVVVGSPTITATFEGLTPTGMLCRTWATGKQDGIDGFTTVIRRGSTPKWDINFSFTIDSKYHNDGALRASRIGLSMYDPTYSAGQDTSTSRKQVLANESDIGLASVFPDGHGTATLTSGNLYAANVAEFKMRANWTCTDRPIDIHDYYFG